MLTRTSAKGCAGVCGAIRDSDFTLVNSNIGVPTLCIAGTDDLATPPELVKALAQTIPNARHQEIDNCGHLPCIEAPCTLADAIKKMRRELT
ncbi:Putative non-heme bromoperoxidase BpoC (plasmid) [Sulfitobacter sp. DSM 110093]|uniref:alpha/beta fold hydrolase n=1 Tax=Sulfitobacter sp. DSM 110093 TaxID=2883127 RepID=UPI001FAE2E2B|nr:alpha/beta fold hydrolase [Sulfitobacter sp. DSM 110093]UOA34281.1 Putative non-heme bromoperoxidase BpoC [Sulfitobacter sp. DSM 110093]